MKTQKEKKHVRVNAYKFYDANEEKHRKRRFALDVVACILLVVGFVLFCICMRQFMR